MHKSMNAIMRKILSQHIPKHTKPCFKLSQCHKDIKSNPKGTRCARRVCCKIEEFEASVSPSQIPIEPHYSYQCVYFWNVVLVLVWKSSNSSDFCSLRTFSTDSEQFPVLLHNTITQPVNAQLGHSSGSQTLLSHEPWTIEHGYSIS